MIEIRRRDEPYLRIGHRGAAALAPENTLASFRAALELGVDLVELDVLRLAGGDLVIAHSDDLFEVSHGVATGRVRDRTLEELRGSAPDLPTLAEALEWFTGEGRELGVHVDLKDRAVAPAVVAELRRFALEERTFVSGFYRTALREIRRLEPRIRTGVTYPRDVLGVHGRPGTGLLEHAFLRAMRWVTPRLVRPLVAGTGATALVLHHTTIGSALVRRAHARGLAVVAWTVDDPEELARVVEAGVDAVVSNDPRIFLSTLPA